MLRLTVQGWLATNPTLDCPQKEAMLAIYDEVKQEAFQAGLVWIDPYPYIDAGGDMLLSWDGSSSLPPFDLHIGIHKDHDGMLFDLSVSSYHGEQRKSARDQLTAVSFLIAKMHRLFLQRGPVRRDSHEDLDEGPRLMLDKEEGATYWTDGRRFTADLKGDWKVQGEIYDDGSPFPALENFVAWHPDFGHVWGSLFATVYADSEEALDSLQRSGIAVGA